MSITIIVDRIVNITYDLNMPGGMEQNTRRFMAYFPNMRFHSFVKGGVRYSRSKFRVQIIVSLLHFVWLLIRTPLHIAHIHYGGPNDLARGIPYILLSRLFGLRIIIQPRFDIDWSLTKWRPPVRAVIRWSLRRALVFVFLTQTLQRNFLRHFPLSDTLVIPNPAPPGYLEEKPLPLESRRHTIVFLGRFCAEKGCGESLQVARRLVADDPNITYEFYGGGAALHSDHQRIIVHRWISGAEKHKVMREATLIVTPSHFEAFGMTNLEALCCGTPVVATRVGGVPDLIHHGQHGLLVEPKDPDQLYEAIRELLTNHALWQQCSLAAYASAQSYNTESILNRWKQVYESVGRSKRVPHAARAST